MAIAMLSRNTAFVGTVRFMAQKVGKRRAGLADAAIRIHKERLAGIDLPDQDAQYQDRSPQATHEDHYGQGVQITDATELRYAASETKASLYVADPRPFGKLADAHEMRSKPSTTVQSQVLGSRARYLTSNGGFSYTSSTSFAFGIDPTWAQPPPPQPYVMEPSRKALPSTPSTR